MDDSATVKQLSADQEANICAEILIMLALLVFALTAGQFLHKSGHKYLQEAGLTVMVGMLAGLIIKYTGESVYIQNLTTRFSSIFIILLLPPIIFGSGYNMHKQSFFQNGGSVLLYSFLGTFIAIFVSSVLFWVVGLTPLSPEFTWKEAFAFGSLISATDPVSVLAIFKEMDADVNLYALVFGESIFNDAVAIVMFEIVTKSGDASLGEELRNGVWGFLVIFVGSLLIGAVSALVISFVLKRQVAEPSERLSQRQQTLQAQSKVMTEISMMMLCPWVSYQIAGGLQLSGIVSILTNGVFLSYYAAPNISPSAKKVITTVYEVMAYATETLVFLFLGIGVFAFDNPFTQMGWGLFITTIVNVNLARALNVIVVTFLVNKGRSEHTKIDRKKQFVMWFSGLRGAMAYALALQASTKLQIGRVILIDTLLYSLLTILVFGSMLQPLLTKLDVKNKPGVASHQSNNNCCNRLKARLAQLESTWFAPFFVKDQDLVQETRDQTEYIETEMGQDPSEQQQQIHRDTLLITP